MVEISGIGASDAQRAGYFQYDTATTHHSMNCLGLLQDIQHNINLPVKAYDGSVSYCQIMGTLVLYHNNKEIHYKDCLYDPRYSNLISGQRIGAHILRQNGNIAVLERQGKIVYQMDVDHQGGLWIKNTEGRINHTNAEVIK